jgi:hypothetical protein
VVAVNAVLAGCPPEVFPVVLTAALALSRPEANLRGVNATTHPVSFMTIVHGDIARTAGFNAGVGAFGPGNRANATVGRAIRLLMLHVAGARPGFGDAATQGQPSKYTYCAAENAEECPWPSYPASIGVNAASAVTVHCGENPHNVHDMEAEGDPVTILGHDLTGHEQCLHALRRVLCRLRARARPEPGQGGARSRRDRLVPA